jgi:hypothetical protein
MSFDAIPFKSNPNFKFKEIVVEKTECLASSYQFDCYKAADGNTYLVSPYWDIDHADKPVHYISLINLKTNEVYKKLEGHKDRVLCARYFKDPYTKKDYLISCDRKYKIIVWSLDDDCKNIFEKEEKYESFIYSVILMFEPNNKIYAVTSTLANGESFIHPLDDKTKKFEIKDTKDLFVYFMTYWWDEKKQEHNIISCGKNKILISQIKPGSNNNTNYHIQTDEKHPYNLGGMVYKNKDKDFLITSATYGLIKVIDLQAKKEFKSITFEDVFLYSFIKWNDHYLLVNDCLQRRILVLDINDFTVKSKVLCPEMYFDRFIKKVDHPIYGESIMSVGIDWKIKLFVNRNITKNDKPAN